MKPSKPNAEMAPKSAGTLLVEEIRQHVAEHLSTNPSKTASNNTNTEVSHQELPPDIAAVGFVGWVG